MSVLVYIDSDNGKIKKNAFEVASYAKAMAEKEGTTVTAVVFNADDTSVLANYGIDKVLSVKSDQLKNFVAKAYAEAVAEAVCKESAKTVVLSSSSNARYLGAILAGKLKAAYITNVVSLPQEDGSFKCHAFTNKAYSFVKSNAEVKVISLAGNAYPTTEKSGVATTEDFNPSFSDKAWDVKVESVDKAQGKVSIADASIIVSGGRGLKGPENWGMIEELADVLGAATACSKPVSDMGWRPHSEHVGQTGKPVASNLYIAIGISGAIQHLAGVDAAKVKVVINNDPDAPFFKAADYGVLGDAFEVVPKLTEKLKVFKAQDS